MRYAAELFCSKGTQGLPPRNFGPWDFLHRKTGGSEGEKWGAIPRATAEWRRSRCDEVEIHTKK